MIYLDTSALFKMLWDEAESSVLHRWMNEHLDIPLISSTLAKIELIRGCRRYDDAAISDAYANLEQVNLIPMRTSIVDTACQVGNSTLRSLDAIHLASALSIRGEISTFCAYDSRLQQAATEAGLPTLAPGQANH